mgnify:CR=1 FL=1
MLDLSGETRLDRNLWALWTHPSDVVCKWWEGKALFLILGWSTMGLLWWLVIRHTNPLFSWNRVLILPYVLVGGLCFAYLAEAAARFYRTKNSSAGVDCLILWFLFLALLLDEVSFFATSIFLVYAVLRAAANTGRKDWLIEAAREVRARSESEKDVGRPYALEMPLPLAAAAGFAGFMDICEAYARWLARKGLIDSWHRGTDSITYFMNADHLPDRLSRRNSRNSWIRVDSAGRCAVFISRRDRRRLGGRRYTLLCEKLVQRLSDTFCTYLLTQPVAIIHRS